MRPGWSACAAAAAIALGLAAGPAAAVAHDLEPLDPGAQPTGAAFAGFRDRVLPGHARASAAAGGFSHLYRAADGSRVEVETSASIGDTPATRVAAQGYVDFLAGRLHGPELSLLRIFIGPPAEINSDCGGAEGVLACYSRGEQRMYVPDRDPGDGGPFTRDYALTHEYGHHIAGNRSDYPFPALNYGAKYWSSYEHVCAGAENGLYFPGNQGVHYFQDPGESFADAYAHLHYPDVLWQFAAGLRPDAGAFAAIRRDVLTPWKRQVRRTLSGFLGVGRDARSFNLGVALDGVVQLKLHGPPGSSFDLEIRDRHHRLITRSRARGSTDATSALVCRAAGVGSATARLRVLRRGGAGRFTVTARYPG